MKKIFLILIGVMVLATVGFGGEEPLVVMRMETDKPFYQAGEMVHVRLIVENLSDKRFTTPHYSFFNFPPDLDMGEKLLFDENGYVKSVGIGIMKCESMSCESPQKNASVLIPVTSQFRVKSGEVGVLASGFITLSKKLPRGQYKLRVEIFSGFPLISQDSGDNDGGYWIYRNSEAAIDVLQNGDLRSSVKRLRRPTK